MQIFLKNVVAAALERGIVAGYHQVTTLPKTKRANPEVVVDILLKSVWKSLDGIIDFRDGDELESAKSERTVGFGSTDVVSSTTLSSEKENDDDEKNFLSRERSYRIHKQ